MTPGDPDIRPGGTAGSPSPWRFVLAAILAALTVAIVGVAVSLLAASLDSPDSGGAAPTTTAPAPATTTTLPPAELTLVTDADQGALVVWYGTTVTATELRDGTLPEGAYPVEIDPGFLEAQRGLGLSVAQFEAQVAYLAARLGPAREAGDGAEGDAVVPAPARFDREGALNVPLLVVNAGDSAQVVTHADLTVLDAAGAPVTKTGRFMAGGALTILPHTASFRLVSFPPAQVLQPGAPGPFTFRIEVVWAGTEPDAPTGAAPPPA